MYNLVEYCQQVLQNNQYIYDLHILVIYTKVAQKIFSPR